MASFFNKFIGSSADNGLGSLPRVNSSMDNAYPIIIVDKIVNLTLAKLTHQNLFNKSRGLGLEDALKSLFINERFKGFLYFSGSELVAVSEGLEPLKELSSFTNKPFEMRSSGNIYKVIVEQSINIGRILANESTNIALASTIMYKAYSLRDKVPQDLAKQVHDSSKKAIENSKETNLLMMDEKDSLEMMPTSLSENNKASTTFAIDNLVLATGFPASFFSGKFENGLGSTSENEKAMIESALMTLYSLYFKKFFMQISDEIEIEKDLTLALSQARGLIDLAQFDERIDIVEIYKILGIPLKA